MKNEQKARYFMQRFYDCRPKELNTHMDEVGRGMYLILRILNDSQGEVLAGDVASRLHMSTPRVAAALNTLEKKGQIVRTSSETDKRKTVVTITDDGRAALEKGDRVMLEIMDHLIESVGEQELEEFLRISQKIAKAFEKKRDSFGNGGE